MTFPDEQSAMLLGIKFLRPEIVVLKIIVSLRAAFVVDTKSKEKV